MAVYVWQKHMKEWEKSLDDNLYNIMDRLKIKEDKLMEIVNVLKEYEVIRD